MARDFRAKQLRTSVIIGSGAIEENKNHLGLVFYPANKASNFDGGITSAGSSATSDNGLNLSHASIGHDVWCVFDGSTKGAGNTTAQRKNGSTVLFLGDVVVSGSLFAERTSIEVDTTTVGRFFAANNSHIGQKSGTSTYALRINPTNGSDSDGTAANSVTVGNDGGTTSFISLNNSHFGNATGFASGGGMTIKTTGELSSSAGIYSNKFFHAGTGTEGWARTAGTVRTSVNVQSPLGIFTDIQANKVTASLGVELQNGGETLKMVKIGSEMVLSSSTNLKLTAGPVVNGAGSGTISLDGSISIGSLDIDRYVRHNGDGDTYFEFPDAGDQVKLVAGGLEFIHITEDATQDKIVFNPTNADVDFTVVGKHANRKWINLNANDSKLELGADDSGNASMKVEAAEITINPDGQTTALKVKDAAGVELFAATPSSKSVKIIGDADGDSIFTVTNGSSNVLDVSDTAVTITGNLVVDGTTTTVNSTTMTVDDTVITLGGDTAPGSADNKDRGVEFRYYDSEARVGFMGWDDSLSGFALYHAATNNSEVFSGTKSDLTVGKLLVDGTANHIDVANSKLTLTSDNNIILDGTSVGIGTNTPNEPLHITETLNTSGVSNSVLKLHTFSSNGFQDGDGPGIKFSGGDGGAADSTIGRLFCARDGADNEGKFGFMAGTNGLEEFMTIRYNGNVGIGVTDPDYRLEVMDTDSFQQKWSRDSDSFATMRVVQFSHTTLATGEAGNFTLDAGGDIELNADGDHVSIKFGGAAGQIDFTQANSGDGVIQQKVDGKDLVFQQFDGHEVIRIGDDRRLYFFDKGGEYISGDGTDLTIASGGDIILDADGNDVTISDANAQLNFNSADHRVYLGGGSSNEIMFRDGVQTTAKSLSDLASVAPASGVMISATGPNRARIMGHTSIDSSDFYLNQGSHPANSHTDTWLYIGDDGSSRTNVVIKNQLAMSGSVRIIDQADGLSQTVLKQNNDILTFEMNQNNGALHTMATFDPSIGIKLGTTAGSGNAGIYFQDSDLNFQKITHTVEGVASSKCIQARGHILPQADNSFNLGTADRRFANLYTGDLHLNNMGSSNDVDGTAGNWTIQEGEDNLYVINNLTGKRFKMMLQPVGEEE